jgi:hypothetical protein
VPFSVRHQRVADQRRSNGMARLWLIHQFKRIRTSEKHRQTGSGAAMMRQVVMAALCVLAALSSGGCLVPTAQGYMDCIVTLTLGVPTTVCTPVH